ncbi:MAG: hypothetical protein ACYCS7_16620 [Acidimicrobiales bacterium]
MRRRRGAWPWVAGTISTISLVVAVVLWVAASTARHNRPFIVTIGAAGAANSAFFAWQVRLAVLRADRDHRLGPFGGGQGENLN